MKHCRLIEEIMILIYRLSMQVPVLRIGVILEKWKNGH